jgi:hypothetical protein
MTKERGIQFCVLINGRLEYFYMKPEDDPTKDYEDHIADVLRREGIHGGKRWGYRCVSRMYEQERKNLLELCEKHGITEAELPHGRFTTNTALCAQIKNRGF